MSRQQAIFAPSLAPLLGIILGIFLSIGLFTGSISSFLLYCSLCIGLVFFLTFINVYPLAIKPLLLICLATSISALRTYFYYQSYHIFPHILEKPNQTLYACATNVSPLTKGRYKQCISLTLNQIATNIATPMQLLPCCNVFIFVAQTTDIRVGDTIIIKDITFKEPSENSYRWYLLKEGIHATLFTEKLSYELIRRPVFSTNRFLIEKQESLLNNLQQKMNPATFSFFSSLFIGNRSFNKWFLEKTTQQFKYWGILHFLARSGLHLVIFIVLWQLLLRIFPLPYLCKQGILTIITIVYFLLSTSSISFMRALIVFILLKAGVIFGRIMNPMHILCLTAILILLYNPMQLFFLDFQLSFLLTFALCWVTQFERFIRS